jgi:hypothetical protein
MKKILKVIDSVNLDKLLDYDFRKYENEYRYDGNGRKSLKIQIKKKDRLVRLTSITAEDSVVLYRLIKDGLIEETQIEDTRHNNAQKAIIERDIYKKALEDVETVFEYYFEGHSDFEKEQPMVKNVLKTIRNAFEEAE